MGRGSFGVGDTVSAAATPASCRGFLGQKVTEQASPGLRSRLGRGFGIGSTPALLSPLSCSLAEHYKHHWFPEKPFKGSGYRCIRINHKMDPIISKAASQIGLSLPQLYQLLPSELTLWVDPYEVSYRIGEDGSICVLYEAAASKPPSSYGMLTCKNQMMLGRSSPSKNYIMTVSS